MDTSTTRRCHKKEKPPLPSGERGFCTGCAYVAKHTDVREHEGKSKDSRGEYLDISAANQYNAASFGKQVVKNPETKRP